MNRLFRVAGIALAFALLAHSAQAAACMNRFRLQSEGEKQVVTLLSGALTFQEAQALANAIKRQVAPPLEWIDGTTKVIAKQTGDLKVIRPMPVGCGNKTSGVVMTVTFVNTTPPAGKMYIRFEGKSVVLFEQQAD